MKEAIKKQVEKFLRKCFLLTKKNINDIKREAKKQNISESALVRHIVHNWFAK